VTQASDAASAMHAFRKDSAETDMVLFDVCLPDSDDLHVLSTMHRLSPTTPVILMTPAGHQSS
jgi:DNA-binding NtrC family response regulator